MNPAVALALIALLLVGPMVSHFIERNIEAYFFVLGLAAMTLAGAWDLSAVRDAAEEPIWITLAVIVVGIAFDATRGWLDRVFRWLRTRIARPILCGAVVFLISLVSSVITVIVAALVLVETVGLMRLEMRTRMRVTVAGCFAIGLGASLTPLGEPLSTLAAHAMGLGFTGLFKLLAAYVLPGMLLCAIVAGILARGDGEGPAPAVVLARARIRESMSSALIQGAKVYIFVAALVLVSRGFTSLALVYVPLLSREALYWGNTISAVMDNATLVALEIHSMTPVRAREAIIALLVSGGMLIPGNVPNIIAAGALRIKATDWAKIGVPMGLVLLGIYFAVLQTVG